MTNALRTILQALTLLGTGMALAVATLMLHRRAGRRATRPTKSPRHLLGALMALTCALLWSLSYVSLKQVSNSVDPSTSSAIVTGSAAVWLALAALLTRTRSPHGSSAAAAPRTTALGFVALCAANVGNFGLSIHALEFVSATHAMAFTNAFPAIVLGLLVVRRKLLLTPLRVAAPSLVLLGMGWLLGARDHDPGPNASILGSLVALGAGVSFAFWTDLGDDFERSAPSMSRRLGLLSSVFTVTSMVLAASLLLPDAPRTPGTADWFLLVANGLRVAVVYVLFQGAVRLAGPLSTAVIVVLQVPLTMLTEAAWSGLPISGELVVGVVAITSSALVLLADGAISPRVTLQE